MEKDRFIERMLETENLTDELEDSDANWLLDWGTARLDEVLEGVSDDEAAGERVNQLMAVMRKINVIAGSYADKNQERLAEEITDLIGLYTRAFGQAGGELSAAEPRVHAARLPQLATREALEFLASGAGGPKKTE